MIVLAKLEIEHREGQKREGLPAKVELKRDKGHGGHTKPITYQVSSLETLKFTGMRRVVVAQVET